MEVICEVEIRRLGRLLLCQDLEKGHTMQRAQPVQRSWGRIVPGVLDNEEAHVVGVE